jgi:hypothetical protein
MELTNDIHTAHSQFMLDCLLANEDMPTRQFLSWGISNDLHIRRFCFRVHNQSYNLLFELVCGSCNTFLMRKVQKKKKRTNTG